MPYTRKWRPAKKRGRPPKIEYSLRLPVKVSKKLADMTYGIPREEDSYVFAWHKGEVIGSFCFQVDEYRKRDGKLKSRMLCACGTSVVKKYQGRGIGVQLWSRAIEHVKPTHVNVTTVSNGGRALVQRLSKLFPKIDWMDVT